MSKKQPDGWTLVPNVITLEMQKAYFEIVDKLLFDVEWSRVNGRYRNQELAYAAMLGAAPKPPQWDNVPAHDSAITVAIRAMAKVDIDDVGSPVADEEYEPYAKAVIGAMKRESGSQAIAMLRSMIDGGEECRGRDSEISDVIRLLEQGR